MDPTIQPNPNLHKAHTSKPYLHAYISTRKKSIFCKYHDFQLQMDTQLKIAILYIKATVSVCLFVFYLSFTYFFFSDVISLSLPLWRSPIDSHSLWSVLGGGGRESPVKHEARGGRAGKDRARGASTRRGGHGRGRIGRGRTGRGRTRRRET